MSSAQTQRAESRTAAAVQRRRHVGRRPALLLGLAALAWLLGFFRFADDVADLQPAAPERTTDAIVVLTGGSERLAAGFDLLADQRAHKLFISGVYRGVEVHELLQRSRALPGDLTCCIVLGHTADDTESNAVETAAWMGEENYRSLRLVTANYHMPRSLIEFRRRLPEAEILPFPVVPQNVHTGDWWRWPGTALLMAGEYNKYLAAWVRARLPIG